jgi:flagellar protein FlgJ
MNVNLLPKAVNASDIAPERLAGNTALSEQQKIAEASRQFEAILLRQILDSSQKSVIASKFTDNSTASGIYRDMITAQLADSISKSGTFGFAKTFEQQLTRADLGVGAGTSSSPGKAHSKELQAGMKTSPPLANPFHKRPAL